VPHDRCQAGAIDVASSTPSDFCSTTKERLMTKSPQRRDGKKVGKTLKEKREAKRSKQEDKKLIER
jgi:hypothetical protein